MQDTSLKFEYKNWKGKTAVRTVKPISVWYGKTQYHPSDGWFLKALDLEKNEERDFSMKDIIKFL